MRPASGRCAALLLALGYAGSAAGSDGRIEIDQVRALAGGVTSGDGAGFPVTLSQPGSYILTGDLTIADENTTAIRVTANDVTIDLDGHRLFGPNDCVPGELVCEFAGTGAGVDAPAPVDAVRVMNGTIWGMGGAGILAGNDARIEDVRLIDNGDVAIVGGEAARVRRVLVEENGFGIQLGSGRLEDSVVRQNLLFGVTINGQAHVVHNVVSENGGPGIAVTFASVLISNASRSNGEDGMRAAGLLLGNVADGNGRCGIVATNHALVLGNTTAHNGFAGIHFREGMMGYRANVVSEPLALTMSSPPTDLGGNLCGSCTPVSNSNCDFTSGGP